MGMEVASCNLHGDENGQVNEFETIKFGSYEEEQEVKGDDAMTNVAKPNIPTNVVDEWPDAPKIHSFWVVKYRLYVDPVLQGEIDQVDTEIKKINQRTAQIIEQLKPKKAARVELKKELGSLSAESSQYGAIINEKIQEMKPLRDALGTLRGSGGGVGICSTEEEFNELIRSLEFKIQHETMSLKEEKQLLREIKDLEATRPQVAANFARRAKIQDSLGKTEVIQDQVKLLGTDLDGVKKQKTKIKERMDHLGRQVKALDDQINPLRDEYAALDEKRKNAFETIRHLRSQRNEGNACFYQNQNTLTRVKELALKKDLKALEELVNAEVEKFMSQWNSSEAFRNDYEKRILSSLDGRQLSRDGRIRNPDEKPLLKPAEARPSPVEAIPKAAQKPQKEDSETSAKAENSPAVDKESEKNKESKAASEVAIEEEEFFVVENPKKIVPKETEVDKAKLEELKKEEEKAKQRQALERKKKKQEKAAAKATLRAQKDAEKKEKEHEKKLKKKEATSTPTANEEDPSEKEAEADEYRKTDSTEVIAETSVPPSKTNEQKENTVSYRKTTKKNPGALPKAILKKKKNNQYWIWAFSSAAAVVVMMLLSLGYNYLF